MSNNHKPTLSCPHCDSIRQSADILTSLTFLGWQMGDIAQCVAVIHARIRRQCVNDYGLNSPEENEYLKWFNGLCDKEFHFINEKFPIEPKFDEQADFRTSLEGK